MINPLSKKYAKALIETYKGDDAKLLAAYKSLTAINATLGVSKFRDILHLSSVSGDAKKELITQVAANDETFFTRFLNILVEENRLVISGAIAEEIRLYLAEKSGSLSGVCYSTFEIGTDTMGRVAKAVSLATGKNIDLTNCIIPKTREFDGIRVEVRDLNVEIKLNKPAISQEIIASILQQIQLKSF